MFGPSQFYTVLSIQPLPTIHVISIGPLKGGCCGFPPSCGLPVWLSGTVANADVRIVPKNSAPIPITTSAIRLICFIILVYHVLLHKSIEGLECMVFVNTKTSGIFNL